MKHSQLIKELTYIVKSENTWTLRKHKPHLATLGSVNLIVGFIIVKSENM